MNALMTAAQRMARQAGRILTAAQQSGVQVNFKGTVDVVTNADRESEQSIKADIAQSFPEHAVLAEESGASGAGSAPYRWVIDPLDGTVNFAHGQPHFCVLIAVQERGPQGDYHTVASVTLDPMRQEEFVAVQGGGATLNGQPIRVSSTASLIHSAVATGFGYNRLFVPAGQENHAEFCRLNLLTQGARRNGAAGLDLAWVACGRLDMYWEYDLKPWDMAAGLLLVHEAGGQVSGLDGQPIPPDSGTVLASNGLLHAASARALASTAQHPINARTGLAEFLPPEVARKLERL